MSIVKATCSSKYFESHVSSSKHLLSYFGEKKQINKITSKDAQTFIIGLKTKVPKGWTTYYRNTKVLFNYAVNEEYLEKNPFTNIKIPKVQNETPAYLNKHQVDEICSILENTVIREIVITTFYSGLRLSEVCNLKWSNIDFENELLKIGDGIFTTKSKRQRFIPICDSLKTLLLKKLEQSKVGTEYIFVKGNGYPFNIDYVSHKFKEAVKKTNLDQKIHFHSLRHSTASVLAKNGVPLFHIKEILGHSDQSTTQIYAHLQADDLKESIKKLES